MIVRGAFVGVCEEVSNDGGGVLLSLRKNFGGSI